MSTRRTLIAALTAVAIAVPAATAAAQPADMHASTAIAAAKAREAQQPKPGPALARRAARRADDEAARVGHRRGGRGEARAGPALARRDRRRRAPAQVAGVVNAPGATVVDSQAKSTPVAPGQPTWAVNPKPLTPPSRPRPHQERRRRRLDDDRHRRRHARCWSSAASPP